MATAARHGTIIDKRRELPFVLVERVVLRERDLSNNAKLLYFFLVDYAGKQGSCFPGQERLAHDLAVKSVDTVQRALGELRAQRLIGWKQQGHNKPNVYYLLPVEESRLPNPSAHEGARSVEPDTAPMRFPDTAPVRSKQDEVEQESSKQHHTWVMESGGTTAQAGAAGDVVADLVKHGVSPGAADAIVKGHPARLIREKVELLEYLIGAGSPLVEKNPAGWLRRAIEQDYQPPMHFQHAQAAARRRRAEQARHVRQVQVERLQRANELAVPPEQRAKRWLALWEQGRRALGLPQLTAKERVRRLREHIARFTAERDGFFAEHAELRPAAGNRRVPTLAVPEAAERPQSGRSRTGRRKDRVAARAAL